MAAKKWTRDDDKRFEIALVKFHENDPERFENTAKDLGWELKDVIDYYNALVHDINLIESGRYDTIEYPDYSGGISSHTKPMEKHRKRPKPWTEAEHRMFLEGLEKFGKGDMKSISRYIKSRNPSQVASHSQKYYLRKNMDSKAKKRSSIHDMTSVDHAADTRK